MFIHLLMFISMLFGKLNWQLLIAHSILVHRIVCDLADRMTQLIVINRHSIVTQPNINIC